jgi:uncharacterized protein (DUF488 family)
LYIPLFFIRALKPKICKNISMFKRQKILLAILEQFGGELSRKQMQKLLFLYCQLSDSNIYDFVPHNYGCYSFQAATDQQKLINKGFLHDTEQWKLAKPTGIFDKLGYKERDAIWALKKQFSDFDQDEIIRHVYVNFPYYAIRSKIAEELLTEKEMEAIKDATPVVKEPLICSIGYEGISLEAYLNRLIQMDVNVVCDVRKNPLSRKFGFSKTALKNALNAIGVEYLHFRDLGISSDKRQELNSQSDYDALFNEYENSTLKDQQLTLSEIQGLIDSGKRIALLCYERLPQQCHRTRILNSLLSKCSDIAVYTS